MQVRVEFLALRLELPDAVLLHHLDEFALGEFYAIEQRLDAGVRLLADLVVERLHGALHVVGDGQDIARKIGDAVDPRVGDFPLGAAAQVFHLGERAQQPVLQLGGLLAELGDRIGRCSAGCEPRLRRGGLSPPLAVVSFIIHSVENASNSPRISGLRGQKSSLRDRVSSAARILLTTLAV